MANQPLPQASLCLLNSAWAAVLPQAVLPDWGDPVSTGDTAALLGDSGTQLAVQELCRKGQRCPSTSQSCALTTVGPGHGQAAGSGGHAPAKWGHRSQQPLVTVRLACAQRCAATGDTCVWRLSVAKTAPAGVRTCCFQALLHQRLRQGDLDCINMSCCTCLSLLACLAMQVPELNRSPEQPC